jgi:hypothetical protein
MTRQSIIDCHRKVQPLAELKRKADKAWRRKSNLWTQEELDEAEVRAREMEMFFNGSG